MPTHSDIDLNKPFYDAETPDAPAGEVNQGKKQWSMTTLYAARPTPRYATRAIAEAWNKRYAGNAKLQVNPADYPETQSEISPEQVEKNYSRLRDLSERMPNLRIVDIWG
jgi:1,6-anhydro-N-acetylmuramate kinase